VTFGFQNTAKSMNIAIAILATAVTVDLLLTFRTRGIFVGHLFRYMLAKHRRV